MFSKRKVVVLFIAMAILSLFTYPDSQAQDVRLMEKEELVELLGNPEVVILDVRRRVDWSMSNRKVKGAIREDPGMYKTWTRKYSKEKVIVLYCA